MERHKPLTVHRKRVAAATCRAWAKLEGAFGPIGAKPTTVNAEAMMALVDTLVELTTRPRPIAGAQSLLQFATDWLDEYERALPL